MLKADINRKPRWYHGGVAGGMAVFCTHPLDLLKVHLQTQQTGKIRASQMAVSIIRSQGALALYNGVSASVGRQLTYTTARFAVYDLLRPFIISEGEKNPSLVKKMLLASVGGFVGGIVGTPCDVINVRMQNDIKLPMNQRRNYRHVFHGLFSTAKGEGVKSLFNGVQMATLRAILMTNGQIAFYDQIKQNLLNTSYFKDNIVTHFTSSFLAAALATAMTQPADVLKTRLMNAKPGEFNSTWHCVVDTGKVGPLGYFKGFVPAFVRLGPQTILMWVFKEQMRIRLGKT
ncbi:mitochondrial dicarboxylate carrier-like [Styela clava]